MFQHLRAHNDIETEPFVQQIFKVARPKSEIGQSIPSAGFTNGRLVDINAQDVIPRVRERQRNEISCPTPVVQNLQDILSRPSLRPAHPFLNDPDPLYDSVLSLRKERLLDNRVIP
jgi:hypothetical protein